MFLVLGILAALYSRAQTGEGDVIDAAMVDGVSSLMTMFWTLTENQLWSPGRGTNVIDGGAPFYDTYECSDRRYVAVGAIEPPFYAQLLQGLRIDPANLPAQDNEAAWPELRERFAAVFLTQSRDSWVKVFADLDACVTPVLALTEVPSHVHMATRKTIVEAFGQHQPAAAPRFASMPHADYNPPRPPGVDTASVLADWGVDEPSSG
jgi:alpha-methylacyl-CoA racemase